MDLDDTNMKKRTFYIEQINALLEHYTPINACICQKAQICPCNELSDIHYIYTSGYSPERIPYKLYFTIQKNNYELELHEDNIIFKYTCGHKFEVSLGLTSEEYAMLLLQFHAAYKDYLKVVHETMIVPTNPTFESQLMEGCIPDATE